LQNKNQIAIKHAIKLADKFNSDKIIFHPELKENDSCTLEVLINFIKSNYDERLHMEGMPYSSEGFTHFAKTIEEIRSLMRSLDIKYCLDFAHTCEYLTKEGIPLSNIEKYLELRPNHFHITDTDLTKVFNKNYNEEHVNFGEGTMDLELCKRLLPESSWVTIETPPINYQQQIKEIEFLRR
jgi:endonuclease IV